MKMRCVIVDDEFPARELLSDFIHKVPQLELVGSCKNPVEAMEVLHQQQVDLMFLDIQMPELTGVEFLRSLNKKPMVIFTTAYPDYALEGYKLSVIDYLLKPFSFERFFEAVNKGLDLFLLKQNRSDTPVSQGSEKNYITIKADHKIHKVNFDDIFYIEGLREYVTFHTSTGKIITLESLKKLEETLPSHFLRIHKSFIVNKNKVKALYGNQLEINGKYIPIGKSYKEQVIDKIFK
ncbi:LytTR family DNA-binding domain-containing protein [Fulvivirgaceae bacterium BMA10]|uniref:LytTR family DNA-binding domain-containing protein n=1 Tax=Splendidivirga corallicola TaxID=3051826 RepID=A0ABT8KNT4_9BACT|nr:LytTR family DNA-binding domain-containing protein [Fulvivirgaceae bacterium BMA10]